MEFLVSDFLVGCCIISEGNCIVVEYIVFYLRVYGYIFFEGVDNYL